MPIEPSDTVNQMRDDLNRMQRRNRELEQQLAECRNGKLPEDQHLDPDLISVESMIASKTGEPLVVLRWFTHIAQLPVNAAREIAFNLLDAVEAAKSDAFLVDFITNRLGTDDPKILGGLILDFRNYRDGLSRKKDD